MMRTETKRTVIENETSHNNSKNKNKQLNAQTKSSSIPSSSYRNSRMMYQKSSTSSTSVPPKQQITTDSEANREITIQDLCLRDKQRLRELITTIGRLDREKQEANERVEKLRKQNETIVKETNNLRTKMNQNVVMLRTYQTKLEQMIQENVDLKKKYEEEKVQMKV
jgi:chromosome segregation ATPase